MTEEDLFRYAVQREQEDQNIYKEYSSEVQNPGLLQLLRSLADQEREHEKELQSILESSGTGTLLRKEDLASFDIAEYSPSSEYSKELNVNDFLNHVIEREETGVRFYSALASLSIDEQLSFQFNNLSFEEQKHKNWAVDRYELELLSL